MAKQQYTAEQIIAAIRETKGLVTLAARKLGCDPDTVRNYARRYVAVQHALTDEREAMNDVAELSMYKALQEGEAWAVCFYLKTQGRHRGYVEKTEHDHSGDILIRVQYEDAHAA